MSDRIVSGETSVEALLTDLLHEQGIERRGDARLAAEELTAPTEVILGSPPMSDLPAHFEASVTEGLEQLATQYEAFPQKGTLASLELEVLGLIGLGLEGKLSGPRTVAPEISRGSSSNDVSAPPTAVAETGLPTDSVSSVTIGEVGLSAEDLAYYDAIMTATDRTIPEPMGRELAQELRHALERLDVDWSNRDELRTHVEEHLRSLLRTKGMADTDVEQLVGPITECAERFHSGTSA